MATNPTEVVDMRHAIAWILERLLRLVVPSPGRSRSVEQTPPTATCADGVPCADAALLLAVHGVDLGACLAARAAR
ncbi:hypothetical protein ACZ90_08575 [Streptomyces albus subsp. albus]|nr:hypothetical protein ACZ90_08575 [Streptomyces albus subsp. albus]